MQPVVLVLSLVVRRPRRRLSAARAGGNDTGTSVASGHAHTPDVTTASPQGATQPAGRSRTTTTASIPFPPFPVNFPRSEGKPVRCYRWRFVAALAVGRLCRLRRRAVLCRAIQLRVPRSRRATCRFLCVGRSGEAFSGMPFTAGWSRRISAHRHRFLRTSFDLLSASGSVVT